MSNRPMQKANAYLLGAGIALALGAAGIGGSLHIPSDPVLWAIGAAFAIFVVKDIGSDS